MTVDKVVKMRFQKRKAQVLTRLKKEAITLFRGGVTKKEVMEVINVAYTDSL